MTTPQHVAVVGSGALASSLCRSLASLAPPRRPDTDPITVTVLARNLDAVEQLVRDCRVRTAVGGTAAVFTARPLGDEAATLAALQPAVLVCCASAQSPYEKATRPSPWTRLVEQAGFGVTLPLQATVAVRLARAVATASPHTLLVNGCFPDAVNPLLAMLGLPVLCGIGNAATLAACLQAALGLPDQRRLAVLAHHAHLTEPDDPADEVRAWLDGAPVPGVSALLAADRAQPRRDLNAIAGHAAARLLTDLLSGAEVHTSLPGPLGLPGGYPVRLTGGAVALNLPGLDPAEAVAWNNRAGRPDGIEVGDGRVHHLPRAAAALEAYLPEVAHGWAAADYDTVRDRFCDLRSRLRPVAPALV
ncbi:potassium transporter TrkA [Catellatospora sp. NPDC049609]|uniref:potassium transporter TrkA n=1 Tax=Catellatospora sp. NPDC049609 TaxID=3155505 RepID=UPI0034257627